MLEEAYQTVSLMFRMHLYECCVWVRQGALTEQEIADAVQHIGVPGDYESVRWDDHAVSKCVLSTEIST